MASISGDDSSGDEELVDELLMAVADPLVKTLKQEIGPERLSLDRIFRPLAGHMRRSLLLCTAIHWPAHPVLETSCVYDCSPCNLLCLLAVCVAGSVQYIGHLLHGGEGAANVHAPCAARVHGLG
jgi:hypothetical protein